MSGAVILSVEKPVEKLSQWISVTDEMLIDAGYGTPEMIAKDEARRSEHRASWLALSWHKRLRLTWAVRWDDWRRRTAHARRALAGIECERE